MESSTLSSHFPGGVVLHGFPSLPSFTAIAINFLEIALTAGVLTILTTCIRNRYFHPLSPIPGPVLGSLTCLYHIFRLQSGREYLHDQQLHAKYGPIVRVAPNLLIFNDHKLLPVVYHRRADKTNFYAEGAWEKGGWASVFNVRPWQQHAQSRRRVAQPFSVTSVNKMSGMIKQRIDKWIAKLGEFADAGTAFNFKPWPQHLAFDVISELSFGEPIGFVETGSDVFHLEQGIEDSLRLVGLFERSPSLVKFMERTGLDRLFAFKPTDKHGLGALGRFRDRLIQERLEKPTEKPDILSHFLGGSRPRLEKLHLHFDHNLINLSLLVAKNSDGTPIAIEQVKAELLLFLFAGSDTTAILMRNTILNVVRNPAIYAKLQATDLSASNLASPTPSYAYIEACIKEAFRFRGVVPIVLPRLVSEGGITWNGMHIPAGTEMGANVYTIMRDPALYGDDVEEFNPERYYEQSPERLHELEAYNFSWGYGTRICLGRPIAEVEVYNALRKFFTTFDVEIMNSERPIEEGGFNVYKHGPIMMKLKRRA